MGNYVRFVLVHLVTAHLYILSFGDRRYLDPHPAMSTKRARP